MHRGPRRYVNCTNSDEGKLLGVGDAGQMEGRRNKRHRRKVDRARLVFSAPSSEPQTSQVQQAGDSVRLPWKQRWLTNYNK